MTIRHEAPTRRYRDEGVTLVEVMVAMLVFAVIATGVVASMTTITRMTVDNRARVTAANLASQDIDLVRAIGDPTEIVAATSSTPTPVTVDGRVYSVKRSVSWISSSGNDISCSTPTNPFYLRVNVRVTWPEMLATTPAVQDDTIIAPAGRISDSSLGSIGVSVTGATNDPQSGVSVNVAQNGGSGKALTTQPSATGPDGCTYANNVTPGNYDVTISKSGGGWLTSDQASSKTMTVQVTAGSTVSPSFPLYAKAATFTTNYVSKPITYNGAYGAFALPTNLETSFTNSSGTWTSTSVKGAAVPRFPFSTGYGVIAGLILKGTSTTCQSADPGAWPDNAPPLQPVVHPTAFASAGASTTVDVPVAVVLVKAPANNSVFATQGGTWPSSSPLPPCDITGSQYTWAAKTTGQWQALALPYGTWRVSYGSTFGSSTPVPAANLQSASSTYPQYAVGGDGFVILDPRS